MLAAAEAGNLPNVKRLLDEKGMLDLVADVNVKGLDQWTALHFASNEGRLDVVKELLAHPEIEKEPRSSIQRTPLHLAAIRGHTQILRVLIAAGSDKDCKDQDENTPLHQASEFGHIECIIFLVKEANADMTLKNKYGYIPMNIA